jgi:hypothetical protein
MFERQDFARNQTHGSRQAKNAVLVANRTQRTIHQKQSDFPEQKALLIAQKRSGAALVQIAYWTRI